MRILYAIQGTGNGHLSRAMELVPQFTRHGQVDVLLSGTQCEIALPFEVRHRLHGLGFVFGKKGGIDFYATYAHNRVRRFMREVNTLPIDRYDLVISDFEPVSAWACHLAGKPCIGLSNQAALLAPGAPVAEKGALLGRFILENYAPVTHAYGFHFQRYSQGIFTPVVRREVRQATVADEGHVTVYLPAYDDERILSRLAEIPFQRFEVFSKYTDKAYDVGSTLVRPIDGRAFLHSMRTSTGVLCAAGFGTTTEALTLGKRLCVIPQRHQFEQQCNAMALAALGVRVVPSLKFKHMHLVEDWLNEDEPIKVDYPDNAALIADTIVAAHSPYAHLAVNALGAVA